MNRLWNFITESEDVEIIRAAFWALQNFDFTELTLQHVPNILYNNVKLPKEYQIEIAASHDNPNNVPLTAADIVPYIPGECLSIELFRNINKNALDNAVEFVIHLIETEITQFRSGVYSQPENRPEPKELQHLHARSQLRAVIKFICEQAEHKSETSVALMCLKCVAKMYSRPIPPLSWFFLIEYINNGIRFDGSRADDQFEMKKYALLIAANQIAHSGSAKTIVENYLQTFDANAKDLKEIQMALKISIKSLNGVSTRIFSTFLRNTFTYLYSLSTSSNFEEKCHLEMGLQAIVKTFDNKCLISENIDIIVDEVSRFNEILVVGSKVCKFHIYQNISYKIHIWIYYEFFQIYDAYSTCIMKLPSENLDRLSTPFEWTCDNFRKSLSVRAKAVSFQKKFLKISNPFMWLNLLVDNVSDQIDLPA